MPAYHITWGTHNSRVSERMITFRVKTGEPLRLTDAQEIEVAESIQRTIRRNKLCVLAYNSCVDHIHLLLVCHAKRRDTLVGRLKAEATQRYKSKHHITAEFHLWAQKYDHRLIGSDDYLSNTIEYIRFNRRRHRLPANPGLRPVVSKMITRVEDVKDWLNGT